MSRTGRWVFIPDKTEDDSPLAGCLIGALIVFILFSLLYAFIAPNYEFEPTNNSPSNEESLSFDHWLFSSSIKGVIKIDPGDYERSGGLYEIESEFTGRWDGDKLILDLDSLGRIWNNDEPLEVEIIGDSIVRYRGRELEGGRTWLNFPGTY